MPPKSIQNSRIGKAVASQRSFKAVACIKRWFENLRDPKESHMDSGSKAKRKARQTMTLWKSDQPIVVCAGESPVHGEGADSYIG